MAWLLCLKPDELDFVSWLDTRQVPWPGQPDRVCDTVAHLRDQRKGGAPFAAVVEFQILPDELMFGRGLRYLGDLWESCKPTRHKGDRFGVGLVVVNLTGQGTASRNMRLSGTRMKTILGVEERNLATLSAKKVMAQIASGTAPRALLVWVPLFKGGNREGIIPEWKRLAGQEKNPHRRRALGLVVIFAEAAGCGEMWRDALKEWNVLESKIVNEWKADAAVKAMVRTVLAILEFKFQSIPVPLASRIRACTDQELLVQWAQHAGKAMALDEFCREAGL